MLLAVADASALRSPKSSLLGGAVELKWSSMSFDAYATYTNGNVGVYPASDKVCLSCSAGIVHNL